jgi:AraC-like DNA-binding protein
MSMNKIRFVLLLILAALPVIAALSAVVYSYTNTLFIFPSEKYYAIGWWPHSSEESTVDSFRVSSKKIMFEYTLKGSPAYAGFNIYLDRNYPFFDLTKYSELTVKLSTERALHFGVLIETFEKGITQLSNGGYSPLRYCQTRPEITARTATYTIKLADLKEPEWWITLYAPRGKALEPNPLKESSVLQFFFDDTEIVGQRDRIEVEEISFHPAIGLIRLLVIAGSIVYYAAFVGVFFLPRIRKNIEANRAKLLSSYKRIDPISTKEKETMIVKSYIMEKYDNPDISLEIISGEIGISQKRITDIVRKEYAMTPKECISWLRIQEAKRLLSETDMNVTDIAFRLGFNSTSYFGSIFKGREGLSPKEYREKHGSAK